MQSLSGKAQTLQAQLLSKYIASLPQKRARMENCWQRLQSSDWRADALAKLKGEAHRLAGSAGSYGLEELGALALNLEESLKSSASSAQQRSDITLQFNHLVRALDKAVNDKA